MWKPIKKKGFVLFFFNCDATRNVPSIFAPHFFESQLKLGSADSRCAPAYLSFPSGSSDSPTPASAEGASLGGGTFPGFHQGEGTTLSRSYKVTLRRRNLHICTPSPLVKNSTPPEPSVLK